MAVDQNSLVGAGNKLFGIDQRIAIAGHNFGAVDSGSEQEFFPSVGALQHIIVVLG